MRLIRLLKGELAREAAEWVEEGLISESQAEGICRRYGTDYQAVNSRTQGYAVLVGLAYLFLGLALITLLGANWDAIPRGVRMGGLVLLTVATHTLAVYRYACGERGTGVGLMLLGNLFYGASIILIAQIYHLGEHMPDGVFWWALGCLPFALVTCNPWLALQANLLALIWFFLEVFNGYLPGLFPLFFLISAYVLWRGPQSALLLLVAVASVGLWVEYGLSWLWGDGSGGLLFDVRGENVVVAAGLFLLLFALSHWLSQRPESKPRDYAALLSIWSLRFALVFMLVMSFASPWRALLDYDWPHQLGMWLMLIVLGAAGLWLARKAQRLPSVALLFATLIVVILAVIVDGQPEHAVGFQLIANFALLGTGIWLIVRGINSGISHYFFLGVTAILATAFLRYIDLIGDYLGGAALFTLFALLLLLAARFWKRVREGESRA
ncbi:hypothetical protein AUP74_02293 [Microbulbifer aggregans]|uniref:DUF2157 domain-containing protein n=1 Tax=Microbulbifer aggregans TaxID=1769779 RepID=A0A1C9W982_9GAMM|nr:DUF2157 domain-containing protein [Microbulbifer aggregans]AOS97701.1 hypothetical protein AUP74_02293 [Microbulbifer aggregans]